MTEADHNKVIALLRGQKLTYHQVKEIVDVLMACYDNIEPVKSSEKEITYLLI